MFEVNGVYANRKGEYTVLEIDPPKMRIRYKDGNEAEVKIDLQERIWANIVVEQEVQAAKDAKKPKKRIKLPKSVEVNYYIKVVTIPEETENSFPGWPEKRIMGSVDGTPKLLSGDRLILYAVEYKTFFAVTTITGKAKRTNPKTYFFLVPEKKRNFFPVDVDTAVKLLKGGALADAIELESYPTFKQDKPEAESFLTINEDDFELLSEAVSEASEEESDDSLDFLEEATEEDEV